MDLDINNHIEVLQDHEQNFKKNKPIRLAKFRILVRPHCEHFGHI